MGTHINKGKNLHFRQGWIRWKSVKCSDDAHKKLAMMAVANETSMCIEIEAAINAYAAAHYQKILPAARLKTVQE